ncbi:MAG: hypothetical protein IKH57_25760 [Clostridia bacterium]|nr:hypothetical protein [Clostridia bacterium]
MPIDMEELFGSDFYEDEDGEYVCDQSQAESIIQQAADDLQAVLSEKAKSIIQQAKEARSELEKIKQEIAWNECRVHETELELREAQQKAENFEKHEMPAKYIQAFVRDATGFYAPGDKVFYAKTVYERKECPICHGKKKINASYEGKMLSVSCPQCSEYGSIGIEHHEVKETEVSNVYLKLCFDKYRANYWNTESVFILGSEYSVNPERLFKTREEAEAFIKTKEGKQDE